jgi:hypothetical protein
MNRREPPYPFGAAGDFISFSHATCEEVMQRTNPQESSEPFQRGFAIVVFALIATILPVNTAAAATTTATAAIQAPASCDGGALVRNLVLVDQAGSEPTTLDTAIAEAEAIWADADVRLVWMPAGARLTRPDAYVVVRGGRQNPVKEAALMSSGGSRQLGWVRFEADGRRANLVEASLPAIKSALQNAWFANRLFRFHPPALQWHLLGRALGRVIAHEIGHWLVGLGHADEGLMRPILRHDDLIAEKVPQLPPAWTDANTGRLAALRARCG